MDLFLNYFTPILCLILISLIPIFITRIYMFVSRKHFLLHSTALKVSLITHSVLFVAFLIVLIIFTQGLGAVALYTYIMLGLVLIGFGLGYKALFLHTKRNRYIVVFSKWNNRIAWQELLDEQKLHTVDITEGSFSFVSKIKFSSISNTEIISLLDSYKTNSALLHPLDVNKAYLLFVYNIFFLGLSLVSFILYFVLIQGL